MGLTYIYHEMYIGNMQQRLPHNLVHSYPHDSHEIYVSKEKIWNKFVHKYTVYVSPWWSVVRPLSTILTYNTPMPIFSWSPLVSTQ